MKWNDYAVIGEKSRALTGGIKQTQCVGVVTDHYGDRVVIKDLRETAKKKIILRRGRNTLPLEHTRWETCSLCMKSRDKSSDGEMWLGCQGGQSERKKKPRCIPYRRHHHQLQHT
jgi:hypothetical protein